MMKTKWFNFKCSQELSVIADALLEYPIKASSTFGFDILDFEDDKLDCQFFEKSVRSIKYYLPNGDEVFDTQTIITNFQFKIYKLNQGSSQLLACITSPPRSIKNFTTLFQKSIEDAVFVSSIIFSLDKLSPILRNEWKAKTLKVQEIQADNIVLDNESISSVVVRSKGNAHDALKSNFKANDVKLKKICISFFHDEKSCRLKASSSGSIESNNLSENQLKDLVVRIAE